MATPMPQHVYTDCRRERLKPAHRNAWWLVASYVALIVGFVILAGKTADAQEACETYVVDDAGFWAWTSFPYVELEYADGTVGRYVDVAEGDYLAHPDGARVVRLTKCATPPTPEPTPTVELTPTPTPEVPTSTPEPTPPGPQPTPTPAATATPESTPTVAPTPTPPESPTPSPTPEESTPTPQRTPTPPPTTVPTPPHGTPSIPTSPTPPTALPETGADPGLLLLTAFALFATGGAALVWRAIRRMDNRS